MCFHRHVQAAPYNPQAWLQTGFIKAFKLMIKKKKKKKNSENCPQESNCEDYFL